jgi:hypothetical protein
MMTVIAKQAGFGDAEVAEIRARVRAREEDDASDPTPSV